jgi:hypothetical protein
MRQWTTNRSVHHGLIAELVAHLTGVGPTGRSGTPFLTAAAQRQGEDGREPHHGRRWAVRAWNLSATEGKNKAELSSSGVTKGRGGAKLERGMSVVKNGGALGRFL